MTRKTILTTDNARKIRAIEISSLIPFIFDIITIAARAIVRIIRNTSTIGVNIYPRLCFFKSKTAVIIKPGRAN
ncbi:MAG TPA: hypothetical protein DEQ09_02335, partial [Bacteroidales bacterium]|nr:hypothetical protein [Bacteroidales bacterium]